MSSGFPYAKVGKNPRKNQWKIKPQLFIWSSRTTQDWSKDPIEKLRQKRGLPNKKEEKTNTNPGAQMQAQNLDTTATSVEEKGERGLCGSQEGKKKSLPRSKRRQKKGTARVLNLKTEIGCQPKEKFNQREISMSSRSRNKKKRKGGEGKNRRERGREGRVTAKNKKTG